MAKTEVRGRWGARSLLALGIAPMLAAGAWLTPASAAEDDSSNAAARFLSGEVLGTNLDDVAELSGVAAENAGDPEPVTDANPLDLTILETINVEAPGGVQLPLSDIIQLGAVNQWASAEDAGTSHAATGAVADNGGVGTGVEAGFPGNATFNLADLIGEQLTEAVAGLQLELGAVSSEAHLTGPASADGEFELSRDYEIAGGRLIVEIPAVADLVPPIEDAVGQVDETLNGLVGPDGAVTGAVEGLGALTDLLALIGADEVEVTATIESELQGAVEEILGTPIGTGSGVELDLANATLIIDLDVLLGGLNDQAPNTEVLSAAVVEQLVAQVGELVDALTQQVVTAVEEALQSATLDLSIYAEVTDPQLGTQLGTLDLSLNDTLGNIVNGSAELEDNSTGTVPALISPVLADVANALIDVVGTTIDGAVFAEGGVLTTLGETVAGALAGLTDVLTPVVELLAGVLSITLNVQPDVASEPISPYFDRPAYGSDPRAEDGPYSVAAVEITALPAEPAAVVTLARSEVGPNVVGEQASETDGAETEGGEIDGGVGAGGVHPAGGVGGGGVDGGGLPDSGSSNQLLILGIALMFAGGIAAYAVSRGRGLSQR